MYPTEEDAARALHGLNNRPLHSRSLRVRALQASEHAGAPRPPMPPPQHHGYQPTSGGALPPPPLAPPAPIPPNVRAFLDSLSPAATHKLLSELRGQAISQPEATRQQLLQFPTLAQAVVHMMARMGTLRTGTQPYTAAGAALAASAAAAAAAAAAQQHMQQQLMLQQQMQQQQQQQQQQLMQQQMQQPLTLEERQQVEQVRGFMSLSDAAVAALPPDSRPAVEQIRYALNTPVERLMQEQLTDLISLRQELQKLFSRY